jgi:hypothetical protein
MKASKHSKEEPHNVLNRIQRGLSGFVSYLAACEMNSAFSEYVLYEPILRILATRGFSVRCEHPFVFPMNPSKKGGDHKRIDFVATKGKIQIAIEVKWAKSHTLKVKNDYDKLLAFKKKNPSSHVFLCVFGRWNHTKDLKLAGGDFVTYLKPVYALMKATQYGCHVYVAKEGGG